MPTLLKIDYSVYPDEYKEEMKIWIATANIKLKGNVAKTMITLDEWISGMHLAGITDKVIESTVEDAFLTGTGPFASFRNSFLRRITGTTNLLERVPRDIGKIRDALYTWICVFVNSCEDCISLHGETRTWSEWMAHGLPGSGVTACLENCNCDIHKEADMGPDLLRSIDLAEERRRELD